MNNDTQSPALFAARHEDSALFAARHEDSALFAARHEDSALFSVDEVLRATAEAAARGRSGSSGFIDVRDLKAPSLGLAGLGRDPEPARAASRRRSRGGLQGMVAVLGLALVGSLTAAVTSPMSAHARHGRGDLSRGLTFHDRVDASDEFAGDVLIIPDEAEASTPAEPELRAEAPEVEPAPAVKAPRRSTSAAAKAAKSTKSDASKTAAKAEPATKAEPVAQGPDPMSVECLLDPGACKKPKAEPAPAVKTPSGPALPEKLDAAALKSGVAAARDAARSQCARLAGGADKIEVKLSIAGSTGAVVSATAQGEAAGSAAATCVEDTLRGARFDRFTAPQQGLLVTVRF